ncbi:MAG: SIMPL domain-containing protein [Candidatus Paceibacterota bacterium]
MDIKIKNNLGKLGMILMAVLIISALWYVSAYSDSVEPDSQFSVSGEGEVVAVPDVAEFTYRVVTEGGTDISALQQENIEKLNSANDFIKESGVEEEDIKTSNYSVAPRYQRYGCEVGPCPPSEIVGYTINQSVTVKVRDFSVIGDLLTGVVERGANSISGPSFTIDDPSEYRNEAREQAIKQAKEKAKSIAKAAGVKLGKLIYISENVNSPYYYNVREESLGMGGSDMAYSAPSIEPGSQEVRVNVNLTYEIK